MIKAVKAKKHLGQHFLINQGIALDISNLITENQIKNVLEIGPGMGVLTKNLLKKSIKLKVVEIDSESINYLKKIIDKWKGPCINSWVKLPFYTGALGFFSYESSVYFSSINLKKAQKPSSLCDLAFWFFDFLAKQFASHPAFCMDAPRQAHGFDNAACWHVAAPVTVRTL